MNRSNMLKKSALAVAISNAIVASMAHAAQIEEIVVTATKREASLQEIPMSVSAISGENLASMGIENIQDIEKAIPGMKIRDVGNHPKLIIRGAGSAGTTDLAVPIYNDGLYRPTASQGLASFVDIERIEVLRGPQGTLFGRNTLGGLLNVITKKPSTDGLDTGLSVSVGDYDLRKFQGFVNVPLSDSVAVRLTATDTTHDPYVENTYDSNAGLIDADNTYVRAQIQFDINDDMDLNLTYGKWSDTANGAGDFGHKVLGVPVNPATRATNGFTGILDNRAGTRDGWQGGKSKNGKFPVDPSAGITDDLRTITYDYRPNRDMEEDSLTLSFNWNLGFANLKVNAGSYDYEGYNILDGDFSVAGTYDPVGEDTTGGWASGEIRTSDSNQVDINLSSIGDTELRWTIGYFNFSEDASYKWIFGDTAASAPQSVAWASWLHGTESTADSSAFYGQAEYDITEELTVTAGARYSDDERTSQGLVVDQSTLDGTPRPGHTASSAAKRTGDDTHTDYRLALQYNISNDIMVFAAASTGYISGAVQQGTGVLLDASENDAIEVGIKSTLLDGSMQLNATYFDSSYDGLTTSELYIVPGTDLFGSRTIPGGGMDSSGLEIEMVWQASDKLRVTSAVTFDNSEFTAFTKDYKYTETNGNSRITVLDGGGKSMDMTGLDTPFSPDVSGNLAVTYEIDMGARGTLIPGIFLYYSDSYNTETIQYFWSQQGSFSTVDLTATWYSASDAYSIQAYINNASDEDYLTGSDTFSNERAVVQFNDPRTWGIRASFNF